MNVYDCNGREILACPANPIVFTCNVCPFHKIIKNQEDIDIIECGYMLHYDGNMSKAPKLNCSQTGLDIDNTEAKVMAKGALNTIKDEIHAPK